MNISIEWLREYLPGAPDAHKAGDILTNGGLPTEKFETHGNDTVMDVEVTSNRGDCLSHIGIARELGALMNQPWNDVAPQAKESSTTASSVTSVAIEANDLCPHYTARIIRGVKIGPSPEWMQRRLKAIGLTPISNVVDVTNYVMFEMGQPLHAFDFDKLSGKKIIVRRARAGEKIITIDGKDRTLDASMLVIADAQKPVALAGVMGGKQTEVSDSTVNILLESARFDALSVRKTSRALGLKSDSSYRFERQLDPTLAERASLRAVQLIAEGAGDGEVLAGLVSAGSSGYSPKKLSLRLSRLKEVLGVELPVNDVTDALKRLSMNPVQSEKSIDVTVPSWRLDINIEVDVVEEVARVVGYEKIPMREEISIRVAPPNLETKTHDMIASVLTSAGYFEAVTVSFVSDALAGEFAAPGQKLPRVAAITRKADAHLRPSLLPGLLEAVRLNETMGTSAKLFEMGAVFRYDSGDKFVEGRTLALVGNDYADVRGTVETLLESLDPELALKIVPEDSVGYTRAGAGRIEWAGKAIGRIGIVAPGIIEKLSLRHTPAAAELDLAALISAARHVPQLVPLPKFPAVRRDVSLVVKESVPFATIESTLDELKLPHLEASEYVTTYRGKPLDKGTKSVTVTLVFRSPESTLTSDQVESSVQRFVASAKDNFGATQRV